MFSDGHLEPIREVLESDESDVIPCWALDRQSAIGQATDSPVVSARARLKQAELVLRLARPLAARELALEALDLIRRTERSDLADLAQGVLAAVAAVQGQ